MVEIKSKITATTTPGFSLLDVVIGVAVLAGGFSAVLAGLGVTQRTVAASKRVGDNQDLNRFVLNSVSCPQMLSANWATCSGQNSFQSAVLRDSSCAVPAGSGGSLVQERFSIRGKCRQPAIPRTLEFDIEYAETGAGGPSNSTQWEPLTSSPLQCSFAPAAAPGPAPVEILNGFAARVMMKAARDAGLIGYQIPAVPPVPGGLCNNVYPAVNVNCEGNFTSDAPTLIEICRVQFAYRHWQNPANLPCGDGISSAGITFMTEPGGGMHASYTTPRNNVSATWNPATSSFILQNAALTQNCSNAYCPINMRGPNTGQNWIDDSNSTVTCLCGASGAAIQEIPPTVCP